MDPPALTLREGRLTVSVTKRGVIVNRSFVFGVIVGVGGLWGYHKFVKPMKSTANH